MSGSLCLVCGQQDQDGLALLSFLICRACEEKIVCTAVWDPAYDRLLGQLKKIWSGQATAG